MIVGWVAAGALGAPVELPPEVILAGGDDPAGWVHALALAGLELGPLGGGSGAEVAVSGDTWRVRVVDELHQSHVFAVAAPSTRADREAIAALIGSLVHPVALPMVELPPPPPLAPARSRPVHAPLVVRVPPPAIAVEPVPEDLQVPESAPERLVPVPLAGPLVDLEDPPPRSRVEIHLAPWGGGGLGLRVRPSVRSAVAAGAWGGVVVQRRWRLGVGLGGTAPAGLDPYYRMSTVDVLGLAAWAPGRWELGPVIGGAWRTVERRVDQGGLVPVVGGALAHRFPLGPGSLRLSLLVETDTRRTLLPEADRVLPPTSGELVVSLWTR